MNKRIIFGLGSNVGDRDYYLNEAVKELKILLCLKDLKRSNVFKNPALLLPDSPPEWNQEFFNIALSADINLEKFSPEEILRIVKEVEKKLGRKDGQRWAPREIDIDILIIEGLKIELGDTLTIPHRDLLNRDFFLLTAKEIESNFLKLIP